jgi:hypothetical protein
MSLLSQPTSEQGDMSEHDDTPKLGGTPTIDQFAKMKAINHKYGISENYSKTD